jgi:hypothetical protein
MEGVKAITAAIPISIQLVTAIIGGKNADIQLTLIKSMPLEMKEYSKANANSDSNHITLPEIIYVVVWICFSIGIITLSMMNY